MENTVNSEILVSEFSSVRSKTARTLNIKTFIDIVRSNRYRQAVQEHRRLKTLPGHEAEAQAIKDAMPCIVPAGVCAGGHAVKDLQAHSGLLCIDLDHTDSRTQEVFDLSCSLPWVCGSFVSISGEGCKLLVRVSTEDVQKNYERLYAAVGNAVGAHVRHPYDAKCRILTQPCFYSWHQEAYYNAEATVFEMPAEEERRQAGNAELSTEQNDAQRNAQGCLQNTAQSNAQNCSQNTAQSNAQNCSQHTAQRNAQSCSQNTAQSNAQSCSQNTAQRNAQNCSQHTAQSNAQGCSQNTAQSNAQSCSQNTVQSNNTPSSAQSNSKSTGVPSASSSSNGAQNTPGFLPRFLDDFEHRNPFVRGSRNDLALKLGRTAASKGFSSEELEQIIALFARHYAAADFTTENIRQRVTAGYQFIISQKTENLASIGVRNGVSVTYNPPQPPKEDESPEVVLEKNNDLRASAPYIPDSVYDRLHPFLKRCCLHAGDKRERDLMLLGCLNSCSALFPYVSFFYKKSLLSPHFYLAVVAPAGTGKGVMSFTSVLLDPTQEFYDQQRREQKKAYEQRLLEWEQEQQLARRQKRMPDINLKPEEPRPLYLKISATTSKSRLIQSLAAAGELGCCMTTTEINTMVSSLGQDCGKYEDILCKAAHHEEVSSSYKIDGDPIVVPHPHLALNIAGTQEQFRAFFRSLEVGLYSRFGIYTRQQSQLWESCAPDEEQIDLRSYFYELGRELREMHKVLLQSPTLVTFSPEQWQQHTDLFSRLLKRSLVEGRESAGGIIYRSGLLAMRLAAILTIFRKMDDYQYAKEYRCTDEDFSTAMDIISTLIEHSLLLSTSLPDTSMPPVSMHRFHRLEEILEDLPKKFTYMEFVHAAQESGVSESTGKRLIQKAVKQQLVAKEGDNYRKRNKRHPKEGYK